MRQLKHLALIMDGNRRWAKKKGLALWKGHNAGAESIQCAIEFCFQQHIKYLSLYTFSIENFKRSEREKSYLFKLLIHQARKNIETFIEKKINVRFIGDRSLFPCEVLDAIHEIEEKTKNGTALFLNMLFCYGARQEIVGGIKSLIKKIKAGVIKEEDVSEKTFSECLWTHGIPEPDLIIRTGGARRLSNFLLYQSAYSELYFLDCYWPELTEEHLLKAIYSFKNCQRNFGV